jgi:hypothetical protein
MSTRDIALSIVAIVAIVATAWLLHDGTGADAIAPIIALGGVAIGRISGANSPAAEAQGVAPDLDAYGDH